MKSTRKRPNSQRQIMEDEPPKKKKKAEKKARKRKADSPTFKIPDKAKGYRDATGKKKKRKSPKSSRQVQSTKRNTEKCKICGQLKNDPDLVYQGHPQYAVEEPTALSDEYLVLYSDGTLMERPQINITGFSIYDVEGHLCPPDSGLVLKNPKIYMSGYLNPICSDSRRIDEQSVPVKDIGPFKQWSISAFGGKNKNCITISTVCADYNLQIPSERYKPIMDNHIEKVKVGEVVTNFIRRYHHLKPTYENMIQNMRSHYIHELNNKKITKRLLRKHAYYVCDQVSNLQANDGNLIALPCMKKVVKSAGINLDKIKTKPEIKNVRKAKPKSWTKATTTPLVRKAFEKFFSKQLDKTNPKVDSQRCGICKVCQLRDCGECNACRGMAKFGGDGLTKKTCINRVCPYAATKQAEEPDNNTKRKYQKGDYYMYDDYMKLKWIGEPVQRDRRRIYYESAEINDERLRKGDYVMLRMLHPHIPSLVARVAYIWKEVYFHPGQGFFHAEVFIKSTHTILGEVGDPREIFLHNRCLHGVPFSGLLRKAYIEKREVLPTDWTNTNEDAEEGPMDDDGKTYFYSKFYDRFKARFEDLPMDPSCPNELRAHKFCPSCERKSLHEDIIIPALIGDPIPRSPIVPANREEWSGISWRGNDYKKGCAVFLRWDNFKLKNRINKRINERKLELKQKKMKLKNAGSTQMAARNPLNKRSTKNTSSTQKTLQPKTKSSIVNTQQLKNKTSKMLPTPKYVVTRKILKPIKNKSPQKALTSKNDKSIENKQEPKNKKFSKETLKLTKETSDKKIKQNQNCQISAQKRLKRNQNSTEKMLIEKQKMATVAVIKSKKKLKQKNKMASAKYTKLNQKKISQKIRKLEESITNVIESKEKVIKILSLVEKLLKLKNKKSSGKQPKTKKKSSSKGELKQDKSLKIKRTSQKKDKPKLSSVVNNQKQENSSENKITYQMKQKLIQKNSPDNIRSSRKKQNNKKCDEKALKPKNKMSTGKVIKSKNKRFSQKIVKLKDISSIQKLVTKKNKKSTETEKVLKPLKNKSPQKTLTPKNDKCTENKLKHKNKPYSKGTLKLTKETSAILKNKYINKEQNSQISAQKRLKQNQNSTEKMMTQKHKMAAVDVIKLKKKLKQKNKIASANHTKLRQKNKKYDEKVLKPKNKTSTGKVIKSKKKRFSQRIVKLRDISSIQKLVIQKNKKPTETEKTLKLMKTKSPQKAPTLKNNKCTENKLKHKNKQCSKEMLKSTKETSIILKSKSINQGHISQISSQKRLKLNHNSTEKMLTQKQKIAAVDVIKSKKKLEQENKMASANFIKLKQKKISQKILKLKELITNVIKSKKKVTKILSLVEKLLKLKNKKSSGKKPKTKKKSSSKVELKQDKSSKNKKTSQKKDKPKISSVENKQKQENSSENKITYQMKQKLTQKNNLDNIRNSRKKQNNKKCDEKVLKPKNKMSTGKVIKSKNIRFSQRIVKLKNISSVQKLVTNKKSTETEKTLKQKNSSENNIASPKKLKPKHKLATQNAIEQEKRSKTKSKNANTTKKTPKLINKLMTQKDSPKNKCASPTKSKPISKSTTLKPLKQDNSLKITKYTSQYKLTPKNKLKIQKQLKQKKSSKNKRPDPKNLKLKGRKILQKKLKQIDEDVYTEYYRKSFDNVRGSNFITREPFSIGYIEAVSTTGYGEFLPPQDYHLTVKIMYRPENTRNRYPHREDQNLVYWSDDVRDVPFSAVAGPCHLVYAKNVPEGKLLQEWLDEDLNRFYFKRAYNRESKRVEKVPSHATAVGKIEHEKAGKEASEATSDCTKKKVRPLRTLDVFAGCGGLSKGLHRAGVSQCRWAVENSEIDALAYSRNNRNCTVFTDDCNALLRDVMAGAKYRGGLKLPMRGDVELLCGGPPCQGFSGMNRFTHRDASSFQNSLVATFLSYCDYYRPKYILLENVLNFASFKRGMVLKLTMRALLDMKYQCTFGILQAGQYGIPQARRRFILIAVAPGHVLPFFPEPTHSFSPKTGALTVKVDNKKFRNNLRWELRAPRRTVTIRDAISDLPKISNSTIDMQLNYRFKPSSHYQRKARKYNPKLRDHIIKETAPLLQARLDRIPRLPNADWRDLPNISVELSDGTKCNVLQYNYEDIRNGRSGTGALRGVCSCASGARCLPQSKQTNTLIPWFLPHTANRHAQWAGVYGRLSSNGFFSTIITNPNPNGKQGRVLHPIEPRVVSVRECARAQGFPDHYVFCGTVQDKYRQIGNAVPPPLGEALGREIKKSLLGIKPI